MIWFDNISSFNTASYYVQQLFSLNKGSNVLQLTMDGKPVTGASNQNGLFASSVWDKDNNEIIVKVVNTSEKAEQLKLNFTGLKKNEKLTNGKLISFNSPDPLAENSIANPSLLKPTENICNVKGNYLEGTIEGHTFHVYKLKLTN